MIGRKLVLLVVAFVASSLAWTDISMPNTFVDSGIIYASDHNENDSTAAQGINDLADTMDIEFMRWSDLSSGDSTLSRLQVDSIRSNPDMDSAVIGYMSGGVVAANYADLDSARVTVMRQLDTLSDYTFIDSVATGFLNVSKVYVDTVKSNPYFDSISLSVINAGGANVATLSSSAWTNNTDVILSGGTQEYKFTDRVTMLCVQGQTSSSGTEVEFYTKDGDGSDDCGLTIYRVGTPEDVSVFERMIIGATAAAPFRIASGASGGGTVRPIKIYTSTNSNQVVVAANGMVGINTESPTATLDVTGSLAVSGACTTGTLNTTTATIGTIIHNVDDDTVMEAASENAHDTIDLARMFNVYDTCAACGGWTTDTVSIDTGTTVRGCEYIFLTYGEDTEPHQIRFRKPDGSWGNYINIDGVAEFVPIYLKFLRWDKGFALLCVD